MDSQAIIMLASLRSNIRGVPMSALRRASALAESCVPATVVTFDYCSDYPIIISNLKKSGYFKNYDFINIFEHFSKRVWPENFPRSRSSIADLIKCADEAEDTAPLLKVATIRLKDGRFVHQYFRNDGTAYLRAVSLGQAYLWEPTLLVELLDEKENAVFSVHSERELWRCFLNDISKAENVHIFQDCSYRDRGDVRNKFVAILRGKRFYNYRIAHGATTDHGHAKPFAIPGWRDVGNRLDDLDGIVFLTEAQKQHWEMATKPRTNTYVIPHEHGVEVDAYTPCRDKKFVMIASLTRLKRVDHAIKAFAMLAPRFPEATLEIFGEGEEKQNLEMLIEKLSLGNQVLLHGYKIDARSSLSGAIASVITSTRESFSMPIVESFAYSCPVISYDINYGPNSLVKNQENGFLLPNGSIEDLSKAMLYLLENSETPLRENAFRESRKFLPSTIISAWLSMMNEVREKKPDYTIIKQTPAQPSNTDAQSE